MKEDGNKYCFKGEKDKLKVVKNIGGCASISDIHITTKGSLCVESDNISCNKVKISIDGKYSWGKKINPINIHSELDGLSSFNVSINTTSINQEGGVVENTGVTFDNRSPLGREYLRKAGIFLKNKDKYNAYKWVKRSAELNYPDGLFGMGKAYETGELSVEKDKKKALEWYLKAANLGHTESQHKAGILLKHDDGAESERWHLKAANKGHAGSQTNLGYMYAKGTGSSIWGNKKLGHKYFLMAAKQGNKVAQRNVCLNFWKGWGAKKDKKKAVKWCKKSADQGHKSATTLLQSIKNDF